MNENVWTSIKKKERKEKKNAEPPIKSINLRMPDKWK